MIEISMKLDSYMKNTTKLDEQEIELICSVCCCSLYININDFNTLPLLNKKHRLMCKGKLEAILI